MVIRVLHFTIAMTMLAGASVAAQRQQSVQVDAVRERARQPYNAGMQHLRQEDFPAAEKAFQQAVALDPAFDMAHYMLGRTYIMMRRYASAVAALTTCRDLHLAEASMESVNRQEVQRQRRRRIDEISERILQLEIALQQNPGRTADQMRNEIRMLHERKRQVEDAERQLPPERAVPAYVSLSLGSAHFRAGNLAEAERAYLATVAADPKVGEAHSNLAVVYLETRRFDDAERAIRAAEKTGFRVSADLKAELKRRKTEGS